MEKNKKNKIDFKKISGKILALILIAMMLLSVAGSLIFYLVFNAR